MQVNKIYNMDCLEGLKQMDNNSVDCIITDPPYNMNKDSWDNINNYHNWLIEIFKECERVLKDSGTLWFFHMYFKDLVEIDNKLSNETKFKHKQLIIINKGIGSVAGRCNTEVLRSYPRATEYLQFYTFEDITGAEQLSETYATKNPMAIYLRNEFKKAKVSNKEIAKLFPSKNGLSTGCVSNWLLGYNFPLKEQYNKMRNYLNNEYLRKEYEYLRKEYEDLRKEYEDLRKEYEDLRKEYEDLRYTFNLQLSITDVWDINFYEEKNNGHCTTKPYKIIKRIIQTATKEGDLVLDIFGGSGTTAWGCKTLNRNYILFEKESKYVSIANKRLSQQILTL